MSKRRASLPKLFFIIVLIVGIFLTPIIGNFVVHASVYNLYSSSCLGGWKNTHLASGIPQLLESGTAPKFTEANSAILNNDANAQIFCGGFKGDILDNTVPKNIQVKFSWGVEYPVIKEEVIEEVVEPAATSSEELIDDEIDAVDIGTDQDVVSEEKTELPEEVAVPEPKEDVSEVEEVVESAESVVVPEGESVTEEQKPLELLLNIFSTPVYADELSDETVIEVAPTEENAPSGLVEVLYTLNGTEWRSLGFVEKDEFSNKSFEIPIKEASRWEDISKIQIGVQSTSIVDGIAPIIYLDSVWIETEYELIEKESRVSVIKSVFKSLFGSDDEEVVMEETEEVYDEVQSEDADYIETAVPGQPDVAVNQSIPLTAPLIKRELEKEIVIDHEATHKCDVIPFTVNVTGREAFSADVNFAGSDDASYTAEIGSLPLGIDVRFTKNFDYQYELDSLDEKLSLDIQNRENTPSGNFTIPIIFTKSGETDSSVICQLNIINE